MPLKPQIGLLNVMPFWPILQMCFQNSTNILHLHITMTDVKGELIKKKICIITYNYIMHAIMCMHGHICMAVIKDIMSSVYSLVSIYSKYHIFLLLGVLSMLSLLVISCHISCFILPKFLDMTE